MMTSSSGGAAGNSRCVRTRVAQCTPAFSDDGDEGAYSDEEDESHRVRYGAVKWWVAA
jgi:hypothetical protein